MTKTKQMQFDQEDAAYKAQRVLEASLFMANRSLSFEELAKLANITDEASVIAGLEALQSAYEQSDHAVEIVINMEMRTAAIQVKAKWLTNVAQLAGKIELHKKSMKMLALIAKKKELLQSDLRKYFKGDIYEYVGELREKGYIERHKVGHSWKLKPTKKFHEEFQITIAEETPIPEIVKSEKAEEKPENQSLTPLENSEEKNS